MIRNILLIVFTFISLGIYATDLEYIEDNRLNGTSWEGIEYGLYGKNNNEIDYKNKLLLFDVQLNFVADEVTWHDGYEWDILQATICKSKLSKTTDKKALKVWKDIFGNHQNEMDELEQAFTNSEMQFYIWRDSSLYVAGLKLKYRLENDCLLVDLKRGSDASIALYNEKGVSTKTIKFCNDFAHRNTDLEHGQPINSVDWTYWTEGNTFCFCFGDMNSILRCPYKMSADGKVITLVLKSKLPKDISGNN